MKHLAALAVGILFSTAVSAHEQRVELSYLKDESYRQEVYPLDQSLVIDLLRRAEHVEEEHRPRYIWAVLKPFINIAKEAQYISAYAFNKVVQTLADLLPAWMQSKQYTHYFKNIAIHNMDMLQRLKVVHKNILLDEFTTNYTSFKTAPTDFLDNLSDQLVYAVEKESEIQRLRHTIMMFLEMHLNKLIWSPEDQVETWESVKGMADTLATLVERDVLDDVNDLDDIYWTLVLRYSHFMNLTYKHLDSAVFSAIKRDIVSSNTLLLELEEQDSCLEKRAECLLNTVMKTEAKKQAHEHGIL